MKLTHKQRVVYNLLKVKNWQSAYDLQCSLGTLRALERKGLVESKSELGSLFMPRIMFKFKIKEDKNGQNNA
jgi:hypothetical protein